jgi:hypothetical protein
MWLKGHSSANDGSKMLEDKKELASILRQTKMTIKYIKTYAMQQNQSNMTAGIFGVVYFQCFQNINFYS